ncbi:MAG: hypothetical protein ACTHW9_09790, partial [Canibacter sp.]
GSVARSLEELLSTVVTTAETLHDYSTQATNPIQGPRYESARDRFCPHEDGESTKRAIEFFFGNDTRHFPVRSARDNRPTVVFWAGSAHKSGNVDSFLRRAITNGKDSATQTTLVIDRTANASKQVIADIKALGRNLSTPSFASGKPVLTEVENAEYDKFIVEELREFDEVRDFLRGNSILAGAFKREYARRLGDAQFDRVILATGLDSHELALAAFAYERGLALNRLDLLYSKVPRRIRSVVKLLVPKGSRLRNCIEHTLRRLTGHQQ